MQLKLYFAVGADFGRPPGPPPSVRPPTVIDAVPVEVGRSRETNTPRALPPEIRRAAPARQRRPEASFRTWSVAREPAPSHDRSLRSGATLRGRNFGFDAGLARPGPVLLDVLV